MRRHTAHAVLCLLAAMNASASTVWEDARVIETSAEGTVVEFSFSEDVHATAHGGEGESYEIRLRGETLSSMWDQKQARFSDDLAAVEEVTFEGSGAAGYRLWVRFGEPVTVVALSQPDLRHVVIRLDRAGLDADDGPLPAVEAPASTQAVTEDVAAGVLAASPRPGVESGPPGGTVPTDSAPPEEECRAALAEGRAAAMKQDYGRAIVLYTKATRSSEVAVRQEALEMLATARERNHQDAHAKLIYEQFLAEYPDAEQTPRIRQRLAGLITRDLPVQKKLDRPDAPGAGWNVVGNVSQFYQRNTLSVDGDPDVVGVDALFNDADVVVDGSVDRVDLGLRLSGSYLHDFGEGTGDRAMLSTGYLEAGVPDWGADVRIGRQNQHTSGVLGRFDGVQLRYQIGPWLRVATLGGYAVDWSDPGFETRRPLYGINAEITMADGAVQFAPFYIEQQVEGMVDRRAVGLEARYFDERASIFSLVDYDTFHEALNAAYVMANVRFADGLTAFGTIDRRRSPYITTENALIGQGVNTLGDLAVDYDHGEILKLAADRTAEMTLATLGFDQRIGVRFQFGADVTYSDYAETEASGDVSATPAREDLYYTLRLRADEIFGTRTYSAVYLRYADMQDGEVRSVYWSNRFAILEAWNLYPRMRFDHRDYSTSDQSQWTIAPSVKIDFRPRRTMFFEFEAGYDHTERTMPVNDMLIEGYYFRLGYRSLF